MSTHDQQQLVEQVSAILTAVHQAQQTTAAVLAVTQNANRLRGNRPVPIGTGGRILAWGGSGRLVGWTLAAGAADVTVTFRDSRDTSGDPVAGPITVPANTSQAFALPDGGAGFGDGLFVDATGTFSGVAWIGADS